MKQHIQCIPKILILTALLLVINSPVNAADTSDPALSQFGSLLLEFERVCIQITCQSSSWVARRPGWMQNVRDAATVQAMKACLLECERSILYRCQMEPWRTKRTPWITAVTEASGMSDLGACLLELERNMIYSTAVSTWRDRRSEWIRKVRSL